MTTWWAPHAALPQGIERDVLLEERDGRWVAITTGVPRPDDAGGGHVEIWEGIALPGLANCHSHAFHRALRGRTHGDGGTFWTWRERMYEVAGRLTPENYRALARAVYAEMALAGVTAVGEFHYVHHRLDATPHPDANAMGAALCEAAREAGVRLTLLDTCYLEGGLTAEGHLPLTPQQRRFGDGSVRAWAARHGALTRDCATDPNTVVGAAIHSVRAVRSDDIPTVVAASEGQPLHAHVSEQPAENQASLAHLGRTPVRVLADAGALGERFTAVHATHLTDDDVRLLGEAHATACFCPGTERDLADGIGPAPALLAAGAGLSLGSDQHAMVDLFDDARALELHERLLTHERGHFTQQQLLDAATDHASIGWPDAGRLEAGARADAVVVDLTSVRTAGALPGQVLMCASAGDVRQVVQGGRRVVRDGVHELGDVGALLSAAIDTLWEQR